MSVTAILLMLLQVAPAQPVVTERTPELDAANDCLVAETRQLLGDQTSAPDVDQRWRLAQIIVERCKNEIAASVRAQPFEDDLTMALSRQGATVNISRADLRRSEALYYVDGMIRAHFAEDAQ